MTRDTDEKKIEKYILGDMPEKERLGFEQRLVVEPDLNTRYQELRLMSNAAMRLGIDRMRDRLTLIEERVEKKQRSSKSFFKRPRFWLGIAATFAVLIGTTWLLNTSQSPEQLFTDYYQPYEWKNATRNESTDIELIQLWKLYKEKKYEALLPMIDGQMAKEDTDPRLRIVQGICQLELEQPIAARATFQQLLKDTNLRLEDQARWYIGLSYLMEGNNTEALPYLEELAKDAAADWHQEAVQLVADLKKG